jgi:PAS domain S-box-containing protein
MVLRKEITLQIKDLLKENPQGLSITDIVKVVPINRNTAGRYLENLLISGQVEMRRLGMAKIYILSQRVPLSAVLSISSELVIQLDNSLRIIFANEPFLKLVGTESKSLLGKNIEYTPVALVFDEAFTRFIENIKEGINGKDSAWDIVLTKKDLIFVCRIAPTVFDDGRKGVSVLLEDITEKKRTEKTLQESEERYRQLVDISPDAVILHQDRKIIFMNPAALNLLGASHSDEFIGKNILDFIHPDFRDVVRKNIEKDLIGSTSPPIELHMLRVDGTSVIVEGRGVKTSIDGKPAIQVAIRDITERKRAEEALRESEATARALLNAPTDSVILIDCEGKILALNEIAASRFGKRSDELVGIMSYDILPKEVAQLRRSLMAPVLEKREMVRFVDQRDGRWYDTVAYPIVNESGNVKKIAIIARDVTEQKNIEKQLRKSEQIYKRLLEQLFDAIAIHKQGKITFLNERAAKVLGAAKPEDLIGRPIFDFIHPESRKDLEDRLKELSATEGMSAPLITEKFIRTDGSTVTVEVMAISFDDNGIPASRVAFREISTP